MEILQRNLDADQQRIASRSNENLLVFAGPGAGKTRLLVNSAAYVLRQSPLQAWRVCCITFSVEAARQLRIRIQGKELGHVPMRRLWIGNFHQLAQALLGSYGHLLGWPRSAGIIGPAEGEDLITDIARELKMANVRSKDVLRAISATKGRRPSSNVEDHRAESLQRLAAAYQERLREAGLRDFDDLLMDATRLLRDYPSVRRIFQDSHQHIFIDELQDTSQIQMDFLRELSDPEVGRVFGVADADQMIYSWRDARLENLEEYREHFGADVEYLGGNYRCPERIVSAAAAVISNNPGRLWVQEPRSLVTDTQGELWDVVAESDAEEMEYIVEIIEQSLCAGVQAASIVVLAAFRFKFDGLITLLTDREIPFVYVGSDDMLNCPMIRLIRVCLLGLSQPNRPLRSEEVILQANALMRCEWIDAQTIERTVLMGSQSAPRALFATLSRELGIDDKIDVLDEDTVGRLQMFQQMLALTVRESSPANAREAANQVMVDWAYLEAAVLRSENAVKLMTTFNAKGLEFHTVILPFCTKRFLPWIPASQRGNPSCLWEARRNFYVALTRSTNRVFFTRVNYEGRSCFLDEIPNELIQSYV